MDRPLLAVTLNPAVDLLLRVENLSLGEVNRATEAHTIPGGKGVNVAAVLAHVGVRVAAAGFLGEENAGIHGAMFAKAGIVDVCVRVPGATRTGVKVTDPARGETTDINLPGPQVGAAALAELRALMLQYALPGSRVLFGGSLPPGVGVEDFAELVAAAKSAGAWVAVDACGDALRAAVDLGVDLVKPNLAELAEWTGRALPDRDAAWAAACEVHARGVGHVLVSLGAGGAFALAPDGVAHAAALPARVVATVGAGDALLAGYLWGLHAGHPIGERLRLATATAWATLQSPHRSLPAVSELCRMAADCELTRGPQ